MRKLITLLVAALLLLTAMPAAAVSVTDLTALARFFPAETTVYAAIRTDDAYIDTLDELVATLDGNLGGLLGGRGLRDQLDTVAREFDPEGDFASVFGWLGDTAAVAFTSADLRLLDQQQVDTPILIAVALDNLQDAELFLDNLMPMGFSKSRVDGGLLYAPDAPSADVPTVLLTPDALFIRPTSLDPAAPILTGGATLADQDGFAAAFAGLPADNYNAIAYLDPVLLRPVVEEIQSEMAEDDLPIEFDLVAALDALGSQAAGFTLSDGRSLVMDVAVNVDDPAALDAAGFALDSGAPLDLAFFDSLGITPTLLLQDTDLGGAIVAGLAALEALGNDADARYEAGELPFDQEDLRGLDDATVFVRQTITGLTGLSLDEFFGWMTGDYVLAASFGKSDLPDVPLLPDLTLAVSATDASAASATADGLTEMFDQLGLNLSTDGDLTTITDFNDVVPDYTLQYGLRDGALVFDTNLATVVEGDSADYAAAYDLASSTYLDGTQSLAYIYFPPFVPFVNQLAEAGDSDARDLAIVLPLLESASVTATYGDDGSGAVRLVITLAD